ncbi:hypothetical protein ORG27_03990 [Stenotrophomonas lactitubi]|uniref:hypothetical protein n=1 Tax=Stenotrophomonas lactitubi TaxID=2045214 RepID=UPI0022492061|nr:hypothetical protein [Stenotrophomonas lactitubi]MCX2892735.1 hypothetical protein [Stenotrophomonas lactitubi]
MNVSKAMQFGDEYSDNAWPRELVRERLLEIDVIENAMGRRRCLRRQAECWCEV